MSLFPVARRMRAVLPDPEAPMTTTVLRCTPSFIIEASAHGERCLELTLSTCQIAKITNDSVTRELTTE